MVRRIMMSVDPEFRKVVRDMKKEDDLSDREISRIIAQRVEGMNILKREKKKDKGGFDVFDF